MNVSCVYGTNNTSELHDSVYLSYTAHVLTYTHHTSKSLKRIRIDQVLIGDTYVNIHKYIHRYGKVQ